VCSVIMLLLAKVGFWGCAPGCTSFRVDIGVGVSMILFAKVGAEGCAPGCAMFRVGIGACVL
jgi:hypothetical protein